MLPATQPLSRNYAEGAALLADLKYLRVDQLPLAYTALTKRIRASQGGAKPNS